MIKFPNKKYNIIYADPPWHFENWNNEKAQTNPLNHILKTTKPTGLGKLQNQTEVKWWLVLGVED